MSNSTQRRFTIARWTLSTFWGWSLGIVLIIALSSLLDAAGIEDMQFYIGLGMGAGVGYAQWLRMKTHRSIGAVWIVSSAAGMGVPFILLDLLLPDTFGYKLPVGVVSGAIVTGILQFSVLRRFSSNAAQWIVPTILGWTAAVLAVLAIDYTKHLPPLISSNLLLALLNLLLILSGGLFLGGMTGGPMKKILGGQTPDASAQTEPGVAPL